jgi:hypothetical protein
MNKKSPIYVGLFCFCFCFFVLYMIVIYLALSAQRQAVKWSKAMFGLFGKKKTEVKEVKSKFPELAGFRLGGTFRLDDLTLKILENNGLLDGARREQMIVSVGVIKFDDGVKMVRYYTNDDGYIQVEVHGDFEDINITDVTLWYFSDSEGIGTKAAWEDELSDVSKPVYEYEVEDDEFIEYTRAINDIDDTVNIAATEVGETTTGEKFAVDHFYMIYERKISDPEVFELLMVSCEERVIRNGLDHKLAYLIGYQISSNDFSIIS